MSLESAKSFIAKMQNDDNFAKSFIACCSDRETRGAFIKEKGFEFTKVEIDEAREALIKASGVSCCGFICEEGGLCLHCQKCVYNYVCMGTCIFEDRSWCKNVSKVWWFML